MCLYVHLVELIRPIATHVAVVFNSKTFHVTHDIYCATSILHLITSDIIIFFFHFGKMRKKES